ncbi:unnamed protein product [marine sediment metagenome]|uniref:Uncharacterized protein n=1 Tax=marine sediment metagenome TaxID=412755 RepID=X1C1C4_9ZZZZ
MKKLSILLLTVVFTTVFVWVGFAAGQKNPAEYKIAWFAPIPHPYFDAVKKGIEVWEKDTGIEVKKVR